MGILALLWDFVKIKKEYSTSLDDIKITLQYYSMTMHPKSAKTPILHTTDRLECYCQDLSLVQ